MPRYNVTVSQALRSQAVISVHATNESMAERGATTQYLNGRAQLITSVDPVGDVSARAVEVAPVSRYQPANYTVVWKSLYTNGVYTTQVTLDADTVTEKDNDTLIRVAATVEFADLQPREFEEGTSTLYDHVTCLIRSGYELFAILHGHQEQVM